MATRMELPTKREYSGEKEKEQEASKKAKREEEAGSVDEIMSDNFVENKAQRDWRLLEAKMEEVSKEARRKEEEEEKVKEQLRSKCRALEYKIYFRAYVDSDRADKISTEEDAHRLFTDEERQMFSKKNWKKNWHMQPTPDDLDEYQRLAVYYSEDDPFYAYSDAHFFHYSYEFDCNYQKFTRHINETIKWNTTLSDARATAEIFWKKYISDDVDMMLLDESIFHAIGVSGAIQTGEELALLFVDTFRREAAGDNFVQALDAIVKEKGFDCYPIIKVLIEKALGEEKKGYPKALNLYNFGLKRYMGKFIDIQSGKISPEDDSRVKDLICNYFRKKSSEASGYDYIDYIKKKNSVARELKILKDDQVLE